MKRWLARIFVFLLLGAIVNIAVAWGCAFRSDADRASFRIRGAGHGRIFLLETRVLGEVFRYVDREEYERLNRAQMIPDWLEEELAADEFVRRSYVQTWYLPRYESVELNGPAQHIAVRVRSGWPAHCLDGLTFAPGARPIGLTVPIPPTSSIEAGAIRIDRKHSHWPDTVTH